MAVDSPYYALTGQDGSFTLTDVPAGTYTLTAWHPQAGKILEQEVTVAAGKTANTNFVFNAPTGQRSAQVVVDNPHFGLEALGKPLSIIPTLERQAQ